MFNYGPMCPDNSLFTKPKTLSALQMARLVALYEEKYQIKLIINFTSEPGKEILNTYRQQGMAEQQQRMDALWARLADYENPNRKYLQYLIDNSDELDTILTLLSLNTDLFPELPRLFDHQQSYFIIMNMLVSLNMDVNSLILLDKSERLSINRAICRLFDENPELYRDFDCKIAETVAKLKAKLARAWDFDDFFCYEMEHVNQEVGQIQALLKPDEKVGYIYTSGNSPDGRMVRYSQHFEFFVLTKFAVLKPTHWNSVTVIKAAHLSARSGEFFDTDFSPFIKVSELDGSPGPTPLQQSTAQGCATLGLACLKELLRDDARLLREKLICFIHCDAVGLGHFYIIPPPSLLQYSQSDLYNQVINSMVMNDKITTMVYKNRTYEIRPLRVILESSLKMLRAKHPDSVFIDHVKHQIETLGQLRRQWTDDFVRAMDKRQRRQIDRHNYYHAWKSQVYHQRADAQLERQALLAIEPLKHFVQTNFSQDAYTGWFFRSQTLVDLIGRAANFDEIKALAQQHSDLQNDRNFSIRSLCQAILSSDKPEKVEDLYFHISGMHKTFELF